MSAISVRTYCTYFDDRFLGRFLALYGSLKEHGGEFHVYALALDAESAERAEALGLPEVRLLRLAELEQAYPELLGVKTAREPLEYVFTLTPFLPSWVFQLDPALQELTYLDADLFFFADPELAWLETGDAPVAIIPHRFSPEVADREVFGRYNVGWITFRRKAAGLFCLDWWRARCLEWCHTVVEPDRYADQKYLDRWPELIPDLREMAHPGLNLGPWNLARHRLEWDASRGLVVVDEVPLVFFHFSSFFRAAPWLYNTNFHSWKVRPDAVARRHVIAPYIRGLRSAEERLAALPPLATTPTRVTPAAKGFWITRKLRALRTVVHGIWVRDHLIVWADRVW